MWAVAGLSAFLVFSLSFASEHLIHLPWPYGTQAASSSKRKVYSKAAISRPLNASLCSLFAALK